MTAASVVARVAATADGQRSWWKTPGENVTFHRHTCHNREDPTLRTSRRASQDVDYDGGGASEPKSFAPESWHVLHVL